MDLAIQTPQQDADLGRLADLWQAADELGYRAAFTFDHLVPLHPGERPGSSHEGPRTGAVLDGWLAAAALGARTRRLAVGTLVTGITYRPAAVLAKLAVTLDRVTDGRAILGVGAGWHRVEHDMFGLPFPPAAERVGLLDETLELFGLLCRQPVTTFHGRYVHVTDAVFEPKPVRTEGVPVLVGGSSAAVLAVAGRHADLYNGFAPPEDWPAVHDRLDDAARAAGRPPAAVERTAYTFAELSGDQRRFGALVERTARTRGGDPAAVSGRLLAGGVDHLASVLARYRDAGLGMLVVSPETDTTPDGLARLAAARASLPAPQAPPAPALPAPAPR